MGDIIKIRMHLAKQPSEFVTSSSSEDLSIISSEELMPQAQNINVIKTSPKVVVDKQVRFSRLNLFVAIYCSLPFFDSKSKSKVIGYHSAVKRVVQYFFHARMTLPVIRTVYKKCCRGALLGPRAPKHKFSSG